MGSIHKRQSLRFQVLIWGIALISLPAAAVAPKTESKEKPAVSQVQTLVQKAAQKQDFSKELKQVTKLKDPTTELTTIFQDPNRMWQERWFSAMALSKYPTDQTKQTLMKGAKDTLSIIRAVSVQTLAVFNDQDSNKVLQEGISDSSLMVRDASIRALGKIKDREAADLLGKELFEQHNYYRGQAIFGIRENIIHAMGEIGSMKSVEPLMKIFTTETNQKLQDLACNSLEKIVKPEDLKSKSKCPDYWISWYKNQNNPTAKK